MKKLGIILGLIMIISVLGITCASAADACSHSSYTWEWVRQSTCTKQGEQHKVCSSCHLTLETRSVAVIPHNMSNPGCEKPSTCSMCGKTEGSPIGHNFGPSTCVNPQTCTRCGKTTGGLGSHSWQPATCSQLSTCKYCGSTTGTYARHSFVNGRCTKCGYTN